MIASLDPRRTGVFVIDVQERLAAAMPAEPLEALLRAVRILGEAARRFELPVILSEQYPKGLGPSCADVTAALDGLGDRLCRIEKVEFSVCAAPAFATTAEALLAERDQWLVVGMETHVCVHQTVRELRRRDVEVHVLGDAVVSRKTGDWRVGLDLMARSGAHVSSTETAVFDLLGRAGTGDFKALSKLIR